MKARPALLILDLVNAFDFKDGDALLRAAKSIAPVVAGLKQQTKAQRGICVYVNDNFGQWQSNFPQLVTYVLGTRGKAVLEELMPGQQDFFILKPKHSAFYQTPLSTLLEKTGTRSLVIAGIATEACVMATAMDAHMRDFQVRTPSNATASASAARQRAALLLLRHNKVDTRAWSPGNWLFSGRR